MLRRLEPSPLLPVLGGLSILLARWAIVTLFEVRPFIAPSPVAVARVLWTKRSLLWANLVPTLIESVAGFVSGDLAACLVARLFVHSRIMERAYFPVAVVFNAIPIIALAPILVQIFGLGITTEIVIAAIIRVIGAIVGEWIGASDGLCALIIQATFNGRSGLLCAAILVSSALALTLFAIVVLAERRLVRWRP